MAYIGREPTNTGEFLLIDDISGDFNGSDVSFTLQVGLLDVTPAAANTVIVLDGVVQEPTTAYSISGSTITFTEAPDNGLSFYGLLAGQSQYIANSSVTNEHISAATSISGSKISTDFGAQNIQITHITASGNISASGIVIADTFQSTGGDIDGISFTDDLNITGNITASGNISASGIFTAEGLVVSDDANITDNLTVGGDLDISDTIYHTGDSNTKIRFPEVDTITFHTSGNERMRISAGGHITASGAVSASGTITANQYGGNISGSVTSTGSFGKIVVGNDIDLVEDQRIHFEADKTTYIESHASDTLRAVVNNRQMFLLDEDTGNRAVFGNGTKVFVGSNNNRIPTASLHIGGDIWASGSTGNVTASGNISSSANIIGNTFTGTFNGALSSSVQIAASISGSRDAASISGSRDAASISGSFGNQRVGTTDDVKFANITGSNNISASGNLSITGNVDVDGTSNFSGNVTLQNDLTVTGRIDAEEIHTTFISSSIAQATGSNIFGDSVGDSHQFTGSIDVSGSGTVLKVSDGNVVVSDTLTATNIGAFTAAGAIDFDNQNMTNVDIDSGNIDAVTFGSTTKSMISGSRDAASISGSFGNQRVGTTDNVQFANVSSSYTSTGSFGNIAIGTNSGSTLVTNRDGNVGIGIVNPTTHYERALHIHESAGSSAIHLTNNTTGTTKNDGTDLIEYQDDFYIWSREPAGNIIIGTNATERIRISGSGNVGIGTGAPTGILTIASSTTPTLTFKDTGGGTDSKIFRLSGGGDAFFFEGRNDADTDAGDVGSDGAIMTFSLTTGNVAIGKSSTVDTDRLFVTDGASPYGGANRMMQIKRNATNGNDTDSFASLLIGNNSNGFVIGYGGTTDRFRFVDGGGTERVSFVNGGNVGIGTTAPSGALHVNGANPTVYITNSTQDGASTLLRMTERKEVDGDAGGYLLYNGSQNRFEIGTNISSTDTPAITLLRDGTGRVGIGTNNPGVQLEVGPTTQGSFGYGAVLASFASASNCTYSGSNSLLWGPTLSISNTTENDDINTAACLRFVHRAGSSGVAAIVSTSGYEDDRADLRFITRGAGNNVSERMQLTRDGLLGIDMLDGSSYAASGTGATKGLHIKTNGVPFIRYTETNSSGGTADFEVYVANGGYTLYDLDDSQTVYSVNTSQVISGDFNDTSDVGLKENISTINDGLSIVNKLNPVTFDWKNKKKGSNSGFIAQEVENFLPDDVSGEDFNTDYQSGRVGDVTEDEDKGFMNVGKSINLGGIVAHLTKAVQELSKKVDSQQKEIEELKS